MTGRELVLVILGAGLAGGASGVAVNLAMTPKEPPVAQVPPEVVERLKSAEAALAAARSEAEASHKRVTELQERVTVAEMKLAREPRGELVAGRDRSGAKVPLTGRVRVNRGDGTADSETGEHPFEINLGEMGVAISDDLGAEVAKAVGDNGLAGATLPPELAAFQQGLALRKLPEADRWQKAKDDLGISWNAVEDLKRAISERDAAMKDAITTEKRTGPNGGQITIQRPDPAKAAHAQADYHDKVARALNEDQRKTWQNKGYENAFGSGPFGGTGTVMMAIDVSTDKHDDAGKDATK